MFTITTTSHPDEPDRTVMTAAQTRGLTRYSWTWTADPDRRRRPCRETPFDTIGLYDHETGHILIETPASLDEFLTNRYADHTEIETLDATWNASLY